MKTILSLMFAVLVLCACNDSKETYLIDFNSFVEDVKTESPNYTEEDWNAVNTKYDKFITIIDEQFSEQLTPEEKMNLSKQKGIYQALKLKNKAKQAKDSIENEIKQRVTETEDMQEGIE